MKKYASKLDTEHTARAMGINLPISTKQAIEISKFIRGKNIAKAKTALRNAIEKKQPIPFTRFNWNVGHRRGKIMAGRYPMKASQNILDLINQVEANAKDLGLDTNNLVIRHIVANKGETSWHFGRKRRRQMKRTHLEVIAEEVAKKEDKPKTSIKTKPEEIKQK